MALLKILRYPDPKLRKKGVSVGKIDGRIHLLLDNMLETMRDERGVGLSAPQVGENIRVVLVSDTRDFEPAEVPADEDASTDLREEEAPVEMPVIEMINPVIEKSSGLMDEDTEGCLSIPGFTGRVKRSKSVEVKWLCRDGKQHSMTASGFTARIVQHEIDHLDGTLFIDRLSALKKQMMLKKMDKVFGAVSDTPQAPVAKKQKKGAAHE
ncbi:MAG: peptide deformylase [Candidatus Mycalebacterium zealandia]|nr:MAG: peptide deformylase [Candidatus Mycalebacterium zealandia]